MIDKQKITFFLERNEGSINVKIDFEPAFLGAETDEGKKLTEQEKQLQNFAAEIAVIVMRHIGED